MDEIRTCFRGNPERRFQFFWIVNGPGPLETCTHRHEPEVCRFAAGPGLVAGAAKNAIVKPDNR